MATWFWLNIPLALLFVCCWAGIPLWLTSTRWNAELKAKNAALAARAATSRPSRSRFRQPRTRPAARPTREFLTKRAARFRRRSQSRTQGRPAHD